MAESAGELRPVLVVAHDYPPIYSASAEVVQQLLRHLPEFGYRPIVLTTGRYGALPSDGTDLIHRAGDVVHTLFAPWRRAAAGVPQEAQYRVATVSSGSWLGRLRDRLMIPDTKIGWLPPAVRAGRRLIADSRPALIYSSSPPETTHLVAAGLRGGKELPWVAHLQDGWLFEPPNTELRRHRLRRMLEARLERRVVERASALVTATEPISDDLRGRFPAAAGRVYTVTNGYDRAEFVGLARQRAADGTFLLVYTGSLSASRQGISPAGFFAAIASLRRNRDDLPLRVRFVGRFSVEEQAMARSLGLAPEIVEFLPPVPRREAHQHQLDADALLLITPPGQRSVATLKLFDYVGAGRPVLALATDNAAAQIVAQYQLGIVVPPDDVPAIAGAIEQLMQQQREGVTWPGFAEAQRQFEWRNLAGEMARVFDQACAHLA